MPVPNIFATATTSIPLANLDANFAYFANAITVSTSTTALTINANNQMATGIAGTASLPSFTRAGDENTGIFFPAADTIAFAEGGVEAMRIDSSGNVGIGTISPTALLHVNGTARASSISLNGVTLSDYNLYSGLVTRVVNGGGIGINSANSTDNAYIYFGSGTSSSAQQSAAIGRIGGDVLSFFTASSERMRITSGGNLYIGTTAGSSKVMVDATGNGTFCHINSGNTAENGNTPWLATLNNSNVASADYGWTFYDSSATGNLLLYRRNGSTTGNLVMTWARGTGDVTVAGALSKGSGSFRIDHPLPQLSESHQLVHSFVEAPQADLIYRGKATLQNGKAIVNIDESAGMTEGTFVALCREVQCFTSNESDWDAVRGFVNGNLLTIECQNNQSIATISWLVIGERQDKHMYETSWTDENGKVIVEPLK